MGNKANPKLIGAFVLGALVLIVAGIMVFGSGEFLKHTLSFVFYFQGSINGLNKGAPVKFRGVRIGQVTNVFIELNYSHASIKTPVFAEIEPDRVVALGVEGYHGQVGTGEIVSDLVKKGLRAQLEVDSFVTGQLYIELDMHPEAPPQVLTKIGPNFEIPTMPSTLQQVTSTLKEVPLKAIFDKLASTLEGIDRFVNSPELGETIDNVQNAANQIKQLAQHLDTVIKPVGAGVQQTLTQARGGIAKADAVADNINHAIGDIQRNIAKVVEQFDKTLQTTQVAMKRADGTLATYQGLVAEGSKTRYDFDTLLVELKAAARSVRLLADYLERNPQSLLRGKTDSDRR